MITASIESTAPDRAEKYHYDSNPAFRDTTLTNFHQSQDGPDIPSSDTTPTGEDLAGTKKLSVSFKKMAPSRESVVTIGHTEWLKLKTINYTDEDGIHRKWDAATRVTKRDNAPDAVMVVPIIKSRRSRTIETLIVEQYRPPLGKYTLEFPAGLVDEGETAQDAALRELHEETGYFGTVEDGCINIDEMQLCMSPGLTDETIQVVVVNVDLDDKRNKNPIQKLEDGEIVIVKRAPLTKTLKQLLGKSTSMPIAMLYTFAIGLEIGAKHL